MRIEELKIEGLRILEAVELAPAEGVNLLVGPNGAGKTSLLEAIHLLGQGRSFRHSDSGPLVREGARAAQVVARLRSASGRALHLGVKRERSALVARCDGRDLHRRSELMRLVPLQMLTPVSHELVEKGPELRRRFLDQGLFHVEQGYHQLVSEYMRAMKQRNAALRRQEPALARSFDAQLADAGEHIHESRQRYLACLQEKLDGFLVELKAGFAVELGLRSGWGDGSLREELGGRTQTDLKLGYTTAGPHRGEVKMVVSGRAASRTLSRGQQKLLVYALGFAQLELMMAGEMEPPLLLIDDLGAELDVERTEAVLGWLLERNVQVFVTALDPGPFDGCGCRMFHVEQGRVTPL